MASGGPRSRPKRDISANIEGALGNGAFPQDVVQPEPVPLQSVSAFLHLLVRGCGQ